MSKVIFKYGVMGSGKTLDLLSTIFNYESDMGLKVWVGKPSLDTRDGKKIKSRAGLEREFVPIKDQIMPQITGDYDAMFIDEAQFLNTSQVDGLIYVARKKKCPIFFYGLKNDSNGNLFEGSKRLIEVGDRLHEVIGLCACGRQAKETGRFDDGVRVKWLKDAVKIDGDVKTEYRPLCHDCFYEKENEDVKETN